MQAFQANAKRLEAADTQVLGVSVDSPFANKKFGEEIKVDIPLLSDMSGDVMKKYGIAKYYEVNGVKVLAARRVNFLIDKQGKVTEIQLDREAVDPTRMVESCERKKLKE
jgi:peroxiredoxin